MFVTSHPVEQSCSSSGPSNHLSSRACLRVFAAIDSLKVATIPLRKARVHASRNECVHFPQLWVGIMCKTGAMGPFRSNPNAQYRFSSNNFVRKFLLSLSIKTTPGPFERKLRKPPSRMVSLRLENLITCQPAVFILLNFIRAY